MSPLVDGHQGGSVSMAAYAIGLEPAAQEA